MRIAKSYHNDERGKSHLKKFVATKFH